MFLSTKCVYPTNGLASGPESRLSCESGVKCSLCHKGAVTRFQGLGKIAGAPDGQACVPWWSWARGEEGRGVARAPAGHPLPLPQRTVLRCSVPPAARVQLLWSREGPCGRPQGPTSSVQGETQRRRRLKEQNSRQLLRGPDAVLGTGQRVHSGCNKRALF